MMKTAFALIIFLLSFVCTAQEGQDNPFLEMAGKPYYNSAIKAMDDNGSNFFYILHAYNGLGLCYAICDDFERSDSCFNTILQGRFLPEEEYAHEEWVGIAEGNLGSNKVHCGEYAQAIPLLQRSVEIMLRHNDYAFASGRAVDLVNAFLRTGDLEQAGYYMDLATTNQFKPRFPRITHLYYEAKCKYCMATGNQALSRVYLDSMLIAKQERDEQFNLQKNSLYPSLDK